MPAQTYNTITKIFHWTTALLVIPLFPLGGIAHDLPQGTNEEIAFKAFLFSIHKTLGVMVFFVALLRILWAISQPKPGPLHPDRKAETLAAEIVHWLLYISLVAVPLSGWIHHAATAGFAPIWWPFGQSLPLVPKSEAVAGLFGAFHGVLTKVMIASILLHVAGALKHQFVDKDATLRRMWFGQADVPATTPHSAGIAPVIAFGIAIIAGGVATYLAMTKNIEGPASVELATVSSDWQVTDGALGITVTQFGSEVTGTFADWTADIRFDPDAGPDYGNVAVTVAIGSLTLGSLSDQAMGADFFDANQFPTATFTGPIAMVNGTYVVNGELTLKGVTAPVVLPFILDDPAADTIQATGAVMVERLAFNVGASLPDETNLAFPVQISFALTATRTE